MLVFDYRDKRFQYFKLDLKIPTQFYFYHNVVLLIAQKLKSLVQYL